MKKRDIEIFYETDSGRIHPGFGFAPKRITGVRTLLQKVAKLLLTKLGTNTYAPQSGCDLQTFLLSGEVLDEDSFSTYINIALQQVEEYIISQQINETLEDEERLLELSIQTVTYDVSSRSFIAEVLVLNAKNDTYLVRV